MALSVVTETRSSLKKSVQPFRPFDIFLTNLGLLLGHSSLFNILQMLKIIILIMLASMKYQTTVLKA